MKVHVPRKNLADSLSHVERIIPNRSSNPGLSLMRIALADKTMTLSGSNLDIDIEARMSADTARRRPFRFTGSGFCSGGEGAAG